MVQRILQSWFKKSWDMLIFSILIDLIFLNQFCTKVLAQAEISRSFFSPFNTDDSNQAIYIDWKVYQAQNSNHITNCGTSEIFGGLLIFTQQTIITKTFLLPPHYKIYLEFKFWRLDPWLGQDFMLYLNGGLALSYSPYNTTGEQICGSGTLGQVDQISKQIDHMGISAIIMILSKQNSASWGISEFRLSVLKCPFMCDWCDSVGDCLKWYKVLVYFTTLTFTDGQGWLKDNAIYNSVQDCGNIQYGNILGFQYYGNFMASQVASVSLNLIVPQQLVRISFIFICVEITGTVTIQVTGDSELYVNQLFIAPIVTQNYLCQTYLKMMQIILYGFTSSLSTTTISIRIPDYVTTVGKTPQFGIRDFEVFTFQESKIIMDESLLHKDDYTLPFEGIFSQQQNCVEGCSNCIRDLCIECFSGWNFDKDSQECIPTCGDQLIIYQEECDDGNLQPNDGCYQCKFSCPLNCVSCEFGQCIFCSNNYQLIDNQCQFSCSFEDEDSLSKYDIQIKEGYYCQISNFLTYTYFHHVIINSNLKLDAQDIQCKVQDYNIFAYQYNKCDYIQPSNCIISIFNECQICSNQFEKTFNGQCLPKCNNGIYQEVEFLEDSIDSQFANYFQCSNCQLECLECHHSFCFQCQKGWNLVDYKCEYECGDGKIAEGSSEQCDDQNQDSGDGCYECKFECSYNCIFCNGHLGCAICREYYEIEGQDCIPICGDGIVIEGFEICDDGNDIKYDGCHDCQYSCRENCQICDHQNCLDICDQGYYYLDNECSSFCGDSIVAFNEQCDDANDDPFDGCDSCFFSCPLYCHNCQNGLCFNCDLGFTMNNNSCQDTCGNGFKSDIEECDDGNHLSLDGCSETCVIETNWACVEEDFKKSSCLQITPPHFNLIFLNQTYNMQYVQLQFTNQIKLLNSSENLTQNFKAYLVDINPSHYNISKQLVIEPDNFSVRDIIYQLRIQILEQQSTQIFLQVQLNTVLVDQYGFQVDNDICTIAIKNPIVLTDAQKKISHKISSYNMAILIFLGLSSIIILISGNPAECFEILDTIQYQSNLKFININFPENLMIYFQSSEVVTILPILEKIWILDIFQDVIGSEQLQAFGKFQSYNINSDLITNLYGLFAQILLGTILLILSYCYLRFIFRPWFTRIRIFIYTNQFIVASQQIGFFIHKLNQFCIGLLKVLSYKGLVYILQVNCWDLIFKTLLYLFSEKDSNMRNIAQTIAAGFILISITALMSMFFKYSLPQLNPNKFTNFRHEGLIIAKKFLILLILMGSQSNSIVQCVLIAFINTFYIALIIFCKMANSKIDLIVILIFEIPIVIFTLLNLSFDSNFVNFLSPKVQVKLGFIQIGLLSVGITAPLIKYASQIKIKLANLLLKWEQKKQKKIQQQSQQTHLFY